MDSGGLAYATFFGGASRDAGNGIAVDGASQAYVKGVTQSSDFLATPRRLKAAPAISHRCLLIRCTPHPAFAAQAGAVWSTKDVGGCPRE